MNAEFLKSSIQQIQEELNTLTKQNGNLTSQQILKLSARLDALIVQYLKLVS